MDTGGNMNSVPLNTTAVTPATPGSDFGTMLMLLQILFRTKKFDQQPEQDLEMKPNFTWSQGTFTTDGQPNPKESKTTHEEHNDVTKIIKKRETADENILYNTQAGVDETRYQMQNSDLNLQNIQEQEEGNLMARSGGMTADEEEYCNSIEGLHPLAVPSPSGNWHHVKLLQKFGPGSKIVIRGRPRWRAPKLSFNLEYSDIIALHIDNRWTAPSIDELVLNTYENGWGPPLILRPSQIHSGSNFVVTIECTQHVFKICINDAFFTTYTHRVSPSMINQLSINNAADIASIYYHGSA